jgi:hypothetical protein
VVAPAAPTPTPAPAATPVTPVVSGATADTAPASTGA